MKTTTALATAALLAASTVSIAQGPPPGITQEMIATALPEEGAPRAVPGRYTVTTEPAFGTAGLMTFRPSALERFPRQDKLPVVVWGNGGCAINAPRYAGLLQTIASHGFLVITTTAASDASQTAAERPRQATADDLKAALDWAERENARSGASLRGKIDTSQMAVMGQSCGGMLSIALGADPRVKTIGVFNAGLQPASAGAAPGPGGVTMDALAKLHGPVLLINGHERDFMMAPSRATFDAIDKLPAFYGARHGAGHTATAYHAGGGEFANVASNWLRWHFKGDQEAAKMFVGRQCGLCTNSTWDTDAKRLQ